MAGTDVRKLCALGLTLSATPFCRPFALEQFVLSPQTCQHLCIEAEAQSIVKSPGSMYNMTCTLEKLILFFEYTNGRICM